MKSASLLFLVCGGLTLAACGDDTTGGGGAGGGSGGGGTTSGTTSSTSGTPGTTSSSSASTSSAAGTSTASGEQGGGGAGQGGEGGDGQGGGAGGEGGAGGGEGGSGGGAGVCPEIPVGDTIEDECAFDGPHALMVEDVAVCMEFEPWPVQVYELAVEEGDCVHMRVDNAGSDGGGTFGFIIDPAGDNIWVSEEAECTIENLDDYLCAEGAITMGSTGDAFLFAGVYAGEGCELGTESPIQVMVSINGVDVQLAPAVCRGDLLELVP